MARDTRPHRPFAGAVRALPTKVEQSLVRPEADPGCDLCEGLVSTFSQFLEDPKNQELVRQVLHSTLCDALPDAMHDVCVAVSACARCWV